MPAPLITLTTDFGDSDGYVAAMKGVILDIAPTARIVDISHAVAPQNIAHAMHVLRNAAPYFPDGTVHVVVVDPGVGTARRPLVVFTSRACFVGPDNGVFSGVYAAGDVGEIRLLSNERYRLPVVSRTFHGRDIFAPFAAHIASGVAPADVGPPIIDPVQLELPAPMRAADGALHGQIVAIDHFGNAISDIPVEWLGEYSDWMFTVGRVEFDGFSDTYGRVQPGARVALGGSSGLLEFAVRNGDAAAELGIAVGARVIARRAALTGGV